MTVEKVISSLCVLLTTMACSAQNSLKLRPDNIDEIIKAMTLHEKALLVVGAGATNASSNIGRTMNIVPGAAGTTTAIPRLGIPSIVFADGPAGLRIDPKREYDSHTYYCTHFPVGICLASSWNENLVETVGSAIGNEMLEYGVDVLLAPGTNIQRNPLCGRNFEYYSEDPVLAGNMAASYINGVQSQGVGTSLKHFAFNNQETARMGNDVHISEKVAREIYLKPFEIAISKSHPWTVMSSYNRVNGRMTSERYDLLTTLLRGEWGYKGMVVTDWYGGSDPIWRGGQTDRIANIKAGNDLIEPGETSDVRTIEKGVRSKCLSMDDLDKCVRRVLELIVKTPHFKGVRFSNEPDLKLHADVALKAAVEGTVLLKNQDALPLSTATAKVALYGIGSYEPIAGGTGSGNVNRAYTISLVEGLRNEGYAIDDSILNRYSLYIKKAKDNFANDKRNWWRSRPNYAERIPSASQLTDAAKENDVAIITFQRISGEGMDRVPADFLLKKEEVELVNQVSRAFHHKGKKCIVVLNIGGLIDLKPLKDEVDAILLPWQSGQEFGRSVAGVISGKCSPSGKLPVTWPLELDDVPSTRNFPTKGIAFSFLQKDLKQYREVKNIGYTSFEEGNNVGYRYFDAGKKPVAYPFGYGLTYSSFQFSEPTVRRLSKDTITVETTVKNIGDRCGKQVIQLYVKKATSKNSDQSHELKAFVKTRELKPDEQQTVRLAIAIQDLATFHEKECRWEIEPGRYELELGTSSRDISYRTSITLKGYAWKAQRILKKL